MSEEVMKKEFKTVMGTSALSKDDLIQKGLLNCALPVAHRLFSGTKVVSLIKNTFPGYRYNKISVIVDYTDRDFMWAYLNDLNQLKEICLFLGMNLLIRIESSWAAKIKQWDWKKEIKFKRLMAKGKIREAVRLQEMRYESEDDVLNRIQSPIVVLSDLGTLGGHGTMSSMWKWRCAELAKKAGKPPLFISPLSIVSPEGFSGKVVSWNDILMKPVNSNDWQLAVKLLIAMIVPIMGGAKPEILRALRMIISDNPEIEFRIWRDPAMIPQTLCPIMKEHEQNRYQELFRSKLNPEIQEKVLDVILRYHSIIPSSVLAEEVLIWSSLVDDETRGRQIKAVSLAEEYMRKTAKTLLTAKSLDEGMMPWCRRLAERHKNNNKLKETHPIFSILNGIAQRKKSISS